MKSGWTLVFLAILLIFMIILGIDFFFGKEGILNPNRSSSVVTEMAFDSSRPGFGVNRLDAALYCDSG